MFGYSLIRTKKLDCLESVGQRVIDARRWLSGFNDLDIIWNWILKLNEYPFQTDAMRDEYAKARETSVYGKHQAEKKVEKLSGDLEEAKIAVRYALATFRALDRYTFEDSDHGLLIAEAVKKLEDVEDA